MLHTTWLGLNTPDLEKIQFHHFLILTCFPTTLYISCWWKQILKLSIYIMFFQLFSKHFHIVLLEVNFTHEEEIKFILQQFNSGKIRRKSVLSLKVEESIVTFIMQSCCTCIVSSSSVHIKLLFNKKTWALVNMTHFKLIIMLFKEETTAIFISCFNYHTLFCVSLSWQYFASRPNR